MRSLGLALEPGHQEITCLGSAEPQNVRIPKASHTAEEEIRRVGAAFKAFAGQDTCRSSGAAFRIFAGKDTRRDWRSTIQRIAADGQGEWVQVL
jgi:hypothetical protein